MIISERPGSLRTPLHTHVESAFRRRIYFPHLEDRVCRCDSNNRGGPNNERFYGKVSWHIVPHNR